MSKRKVVGIDLGETYSSIAHVNEYGEPEVILNAENESRTPSVILFDDDKIVVGIIAKHYARVVPEKIVEFVKREMGKSKEEYSREFNGKEYSAEELAALILLQLKQDAEAKIKTEITDAVITVPADFGDSERHATRLAGEIAGFNVLQVINEPTAAALAFGIDLIGADQTVFVFDLGGGTFDVTIMNVSGSKLKMLATGGDRRLGGKDWDDRIIKYVAENFEIEHGVNPLEDSYAYQDIQRFAIEGKEFLSRLDQCRISCSYDGKAHQVELTREKFEGLTADLLTRCGVLCNDVLSEADMMWKDIDQVLLVGGSTRMPMVQKMLTRISGKEINPTEVNPDEVVAHGAAIYAEVLNPTTRTEHLDLIRKNRMRLIPDLVLYNLGFVFHDARGEAFIQVIISRLTPVPCEVKETWATVVNNQTSVHIELIEWLEHGQYNTLGTLSIDLPPGLPKGSPIRITFKYNQDQVLAVMAEAPDGRIANAMIHRPSLDEAEVAEASEYLQSLEVE